MIGLEVKGVETEGLGFCREGFLDPSGGGHVGT